MPRRLTVCAALLAVAAPAARAQPERAGMPESDGEWPRTADDSTTQQVGGFIGLAAGGRTTPGGLESAGAYLYRLSERDWLQASASFTFGAGTAACFRDRDDQEVCDHALLDGFAGELGAGIRRVFAAQRDLSPFAHLGLALRLVSFSGDELRGVVVPVVGGGGVRARVADSVSVVGAASLRLGLGYFGREVDAEPQLSLSVLGGVEFDLD